MIRAGTRARIAGIAALAAAILPVAAEAQTDELDCDNAQTQVEMTSCAGLAYEAADDDLNALWPDVVAQARAMDEANADLIRERGVPTTVEALRSAQRAWIAFRDAECSYEAYQAFGGTMQPMLGSLCLERLTRERIATLKTLLDALP